MRQSDRVGRIHACARRGYDGRPDTIIDAFVKKSVMPCFVIPCLTRNPVFHWFPVPVPDLDTGFTVTTSGLLLSQE